MAKSYSLPSKPVPSAPKAPFFSWKRAFWSFAALLTLLMFRLSFDYGIIWDEWIQSHYGRLVLKFLVTGGRDLSALHFGKTMYLYGGLFDTLTAAIYSLRFDSIKNIIAYPLHADFILPHWFETRHAVNALFGALTLFYTGLTARKIGGWRAGTLAMLFLAVSPRFFGNSMNNPKDIPFAAASMIAVYYIIALIQEFPKPKRSTQIGIAAGLAMALNIKAGALLLFFNLWLTTGILWLQAKKKNEPIPLKQIAFFLLPISLAGYFGGILFWPYGWQNPFLNPLLALQSFSQFTGAEGHMLFEGNLYAHGKTPWYYLLKWMLISNPLFFVFGIFLFLYFAKDVFRQHGKIIPGFLLFCSFFPLLYAILGHSVVYDGWRHFLFIYPPLIILLALLWDQFLREAKARLCKASLAILLALQIAEPFSWMTKNHPNEYLYFNALAGGVRGAYGQYETDYWGNCFRPAAEWLVKYYQSRQTEPKHVIVRSEGELISSGPFLMSGFGPFYHPSEKENDWAYSLEFARGRKPSDLLSGAWPGPNAVHIVEADGVPLCAVIERK